MQSSTPPGQIIFDPSGEYTYWNEQDGGSLFLRHKNLSERYSINPKSVSQEAAQGVPAPKLLKLNFYEAVAVSHDLIVALWDEINPGNRPGYMVPLLEWAPTDPAQAPPPIQKSAYNHYWRTMSLWFGLLRLAGFQESTNLKVPVEFPATVKQQLVADPAVKSDKDQKGDFATRQSIANLPSLFKAVAKLWETQSPLFATTSGDPYFNDVEQKLLLILKADGSKTGHNYIRPYARFHDLQGSQLFQDISALARSGKTVFIEMARANDQIRRVLSERICQQVLGDMMNEFTNGALGDKFVVLYFEEAHTLFRADDKDLNSVYTVEVAFDVAMIPSI